MKRQEKQRMKSDRRAEKSLARRTASQLPDEAVIQPAEPEPQS
jgi:hypothetical protein